MTCSLALLPSLSPIHQSELVAVAAFRCKFPGGGGRLGGREENMESPERNGSTGFSSQGRAKLRVFPRHKGAEKQAT